MVSRNRIAILLLFFAFIGIRVVHIRADAPRNISFSAGIFTDEMHNIHQVRSKILFGSWSLDRYASAAYSPIFAGLQYLFLSMIGVGLAQIKALPILLSLISLGLIYKSFDTHFGKPFGLTAALVLGFNYIFIMYNRLGLYENLVVLFMCLSLFFWQRAIVWQKRRFFFLFGVSAGGVFVAKSLYLFFVVAAALSMGFYVFQGKKRERAVHVLFGFAGLTAAGAIWYAVCYLPFKETFMILGSSWMKHNMGPKNIPEALQINPIFPLYLRFRFMPVTLLLSAVSLLAYAYRFLKAPKKADPVILLLVLWLLGGAVFLGLLSYSPTRYFLPVLPAAVLLAAVGIARFGYSVRRVKGSVPDIRRYFVGALGGFIFSYYFLIPYAQRDLPRAALVFKMAGPSAVPAWLLSAVIALMVCLVLAAWEGIPHLGRLRGKVAAGFIGAVLLVLIAALFRPVSARVDIELTANKDGYMQLFWAEKDTPFSEAASQKIRIRKGRHAYRIHMASLSSLGRLRIDPLQHKGRATLHGIRIRQPGFEPIVFDTKNRFSGLKPVHEISELHVTANGLEFDSLGHDPHLTAQISPVFQRGQWLFFLAGCILLAALALVLFLWMRLRIVPFLFSPYGNSTRRRLALLAVGIILYINGTAYAGWVRQPVYSIWNTSKHVGTIVSKDALIAGVGVMMATVENKIRHLLAPTWFEDPKTLFQVYPITHLFISPYAGYLDWYKIHYPKVMEHATVLDEYHIGGRHFFLFELHIPDGEKEAVFRYR
ncbi:MAG: glycosyltransferase family 39 protein [Deltaproteobacteria bacterium]|nr:glycosyltransferase family 39 protein [Deltaproteobacteria bacterium]